jgi:hypothetical protein
VPLLRDKTVELYSKTGVDPRLLGYAAEKIGLQVKPNAFRTLQGSAWSSKYKVWIASDSELAKFNLRIKNSRKPYWHRNIEKYVLGQMKFTTLDVAY